MKLNRNIFPGNAKLYFAALLFLLPFLGLADDLPVFESDQQADAWLRKNSRTYQWMAEGIDQRGGYDIESTTNYIGGAAVFLGDRGHIEINTSIKGAHRVGLLIFEMSNLHQDHRHMDVTRRLWAGDIDTAIEFALLRELIEYDGLRFHWNVLKELRKKIDSIPSEMFKWVVPAESFESYETPLAFDYITAQRASGHTDAYIKYFRQCRGLKPAADSEAKAESTNEPPAKVVDAVPEKAKE